MNKRTSPFNELVNIMALLRSPQGCPWDKHQTHQTLKKYLREEAREVREAIDEGYPEHLQEELGDLLLQVVFHAQIARENNDFDINDVIRGLNRKLKRRHPHVFGKVHVKNAAEVVRNWHAIKAREKTRQKPEKKPEKNLTKPYFYAISNIEFKPKRQSPRNRRT